MRLRSFPTALVGTGRTSQPQHVWIGWVKIHVWTRGSQGRAKIGRRCGTRNRRSSGSREGAYTSAVVRRYRRRKNSGSSQGTCGQRACCGAEYRQQVRRNLERLVFVCSEGGGGIRGAIVPRYAEQLLAVQERWKQVEEAAKPMVKLCATAALCSSSVTDARRIRSMRALASL